MICRVCHHAHRPGRDCLDAERQRIGAGQLRARQPPRDERRAIRQGLREAFAADVAAMEASARQREADAMVAHGGPDNAAPWGGMEMGQVWLDEGDDGAPVIATKACKPYLPPPGMVRWRGFVMHKDDVIAFEEQERLAARALLDTSAAHLLDQDPQP